jgi:hypothetical protein
LGRASLSLSLSFSHISFSELFGQAVLTAIAAHASPLRHLLGGTVAAFTAPGTPCAAVFLVRRTTSGRLELSALAPRLRPSVSRQVVPAAVEDGAVPAAVRLLRQLGLTVRAVPDQTDTAGALCWRVARPSHAHTLLRLMRLRWGGGGGVTASRRVVSGAVRFSNLSRL